MKLLVGIRTLYLLALFQLIGGPLVIFSVTILFRQTVREMANHEVTEALSIAWQSPEFHAALGVTTAADRTKSALPNSDPGTGQAKVKSPAIAWHEAPLVLCNPPRRAQVLDFTRRWTPVMPLPPPGPPPRVG